MKYPKEITTVEKTNELVKLLTNDNPKRDVMVADVVFETYEEFKTSKELAEVHSGYQSNTHIKEDEFLSAYAIGKDVFVSYKIDGLRYIKKETIHSLGRSSIKRCV